PADRAEVEWEEIEVDRSVGRGRDAQEIALRLGPHLGVELLEVRRLPAAARAVIDDLRDDLAVLVIVGRHGGDLLPAGAIREPAAGRGDGRRRRAHSGRAGPATPRGRGRAPPSPAGAGAAGS